jgi:hypothetical protein
MTHVRSIVAGAFAALALAGCAQFADLRPTEVDVQLREAPAELQAGVRVRAVGADGATEVLFGSVRPAPVLGPRLEVTLGGPRVDGMPAVDLVAALVPGLVCDPAASNLAAAPATATAVVAERFEVRDGADAVLGRAQAASTIVAAAVGRPTAGGERTATFVYVDRPVRITGACSDGADTVVTGIDLAWGWNLVALSYVSPTVEDLTVLAGPSSIPWYLVAE